MRQAWSIWSLRSFLKLEKPKQNSNSRVLWSKIKAMEELGSLKEQKQPWWELVKDKPSLFTSAISHYRNHIYTIADRWPPVWALIPPVIGNSLFWRPILRSTSGQLSLCFHLLLCWGKIYSLLSGIILTKSTFSCVWPLNLSLVPLGQTLQSIFNCFLRMWGYGFWTLCRLEYPEQSGCSLYECLNDAATADGFSSSISHSIAVGIRAQLRLSLPDKNLFSNVRAPGMGLVEWPRNSLWIVNNELAGTGGPCFPVDRDAPEPSLQRT